jgi:hypothetical protein
MGLVLSSVAVFTSVTYKNSEYRWPMYDALSVWTIAGASDVSAAMMYATIALRDAHAPFGSGVLVQLQRLSPPAADGRWAMGDGRWAMGDGRWAMGDGRWAMGDGRWAMGDKAE